MQLEKLFVEGREIGVDIKILARALFREKENNLFFDDFLMLRSFALKTNHLEIFFLEVKIRIINLIDNNALLIPDKIKYEILQLIDYFDLDRLAFQKIAIYFIENTNNKEEIARFLPIICSNFSFDKINLLFKTSPWKFHDIIKSNKWVNSVCKQPQFLLNFVGKEFVETCEGSNTYEAKLAHLFYDILIQRKISRQSILGFFKIKPIFKIKVISALRRYTAVLRSIEKELPNFYDYKITNISSIDIIFILTINLKISSIEFKNYLIENDTYLNEQELAYCFSRVGINIKTYMFINRFLDEKKLCKVIKELPGEGITSLFESITKNSKQSLDNIPKVQYDELTSVILVTKNPNIKLLQLSIDSILHQTYSNIELILMDDCSDNSDLIKDYIANFPSIIYQRATTPLGVYENRNAALKISKGIYITFQDDDDISHLQRIEYQINQINVNNLDVLSVSHIRFDNLGMVQLDDGTSIISDGPVTLMVRNKIFNIVGDFLPVQSRGDIEFRARCKRLLNENKISHSAVPLYYAYGGHQTLSSAFENNRYSRLELQRSMLIQELF
jgi:hypothetical protein